MISSINTKYTLVIRKFEIINTQIPACQKFNHSKTNNLITYILNF